MRRLAQGVVFSVCLLAVPSVRAAGSELDFRLQDNSGKTWALTDLKDTKAVVVVFMGTQCPINNAYMPRLKELHQAYLTKGVQVIGINANEHDSSAAIAEHARKFGLTFPVCRDARQVVADRFKVERTPEAIVLDAQHKLRYRGRIDDQFGIGFQRQEPTRRDLREALDDVLAGKDVRVAQTPVAGCLVTRAPQPKSAATLSYVKDVAPIVARRCQECHRPGQIGPMPLLNYDDVSSWAAMIGEVVKERRMPPWHADPRHGVFANDRSLSLTERETLLTWIDQGCPRGDGKEPAPIPAVEGWNIGQPDAVFTMTTPYTVPAKAGKGGIPYKHFMVPTNFTEDVWVQAVEAKPGNRAVVHHIIVYVAIDGKRARDPIDGFGSGMLVAYAPGDLGSAFAPGTAKKLPKGATIVFQMHYTPNGVEQTDRSSVGLVFAKEPPAVEIKTRAVSQTLLFIPPESDNHKVFIASTFKNDTIVYSLFPHMHLRGKDFDFEAVYPDGKRQTLLSVPRYDFGWQANYRLKEPLHVPAGTRIECTAHFDNSSRNPNNPDPSRMVRWGEQTWEEMMIGFLDYAEVNARK